MPMKYSNTSGLPASGSGKPSRWNAADGRRKASPKSKGEKDAVKGDVSGIRPEDGTAEMDGGVMLTTSEILDFSEGTDSTP